MTDPIANMLVTMKNATAVSKEMVTVPFSSVKLAIAECLKKSGYVDGVSKKTQKKNVPVLEIALVSGKIHDIKRVSKPSRRVYLGLRDLKPVKNGHGAIVLSTPKGILSDKEAKKEQVGGEALFMIW